MFGPGLVTLIVAGIAFVIISGLVCRWIFSGREFTWSEYGIGTLFCSVVIVPMVFFAGYEIARNAKITHYEYYNGVETNVQMVPIACSRDGSCKWTYRCDSYIHTYQCGSTCITRDKDGNCTSSVPNYCSERRWHSCPYCSQEQNFVVNTTLGDFTIASNRLPPDPQLHRWVANYAVDPEYDEYNSSIPQTVLSSAGIGAPQFWTEVQTRLLNQNPGSVTKRFSYPNYVLANDLTELELYRDEIARLTQASLLPALQYGIRSPYYADKVYFVGITSNDVTDWQSSHSMLNSGLGEELEGDLHLVILNRASLSTVDMSPDDYIHALKAYWQDGAVWGANAISKNSVIVVLATDGEYFYWGRAETGMPWGNDALEAGVTSMISPDLRIPYTPEAILGNVTARLYQEVEEDGSIDIEAEAIHNEPTGLLERMLWGMDDPATRFDRVEMANFFELASQVRPEPVHIVIMAIVAALLTFFVWFVLANTSWFETRRYS